MKTTKKIIILLIAMIAILTFGISTVDAASWIPNSGRKNQCQSIET